MTRFRRLLLGASIFAAAAPGAARADVTAEQAKLLEQQLRGWMAGLLGPAIPLAQRPIRVTPEGDHFTFSIDVAGPLGPKGATVSGAPITATARPLDGGRWDVTDLHLPSPFRFTDPNATGQEPKSWGVKAADQTLRGTFDPSFATTTTLDSEIRGFTQIVESATGASTTHVDHYAGHTVWQPTGDGHVDMRSDGKAEGISTTAPMPDAGGTLTLTAARMTTSGQTARVAVDQVGAVIRGAMQLIPAISAASAAASKQGSPATLSPADRATAHALALAARDSLGGVDTRYALEGIRFAAAGHSGSLASMVFGLGAAAPSGKLDVHMLMTVDGIDSPEIPPGLIHDYVPRHVSLAPRISGVPSEDVMALFNRAIDSTGSDADKQALDAMALALLSKGPLVIGLEDVALDAGPASLKGTATIQVASPAPEDVTGEASIAITGFDDLIKQSSSFPPLKQATPVLIFLKGIGKQTGNAIVWNVSYAAGKVIVNGTDLSGMIPGK